MGFCRASGIPGVGGFDSARAYSRRIIDKDDANRIDMRIESVTHHWAFSFSDSDGCVDPELFLRVMEMHESLLTFCRVGQAADRFAFYVPKKDGAADAARVFGDLQWSQ